MIFKKFILCSVASAALISVPAMADERDDRIEMLEQQLQVMMREIQTLKQAQVQDRAAVAEINQSVESRVVEEVAKIEPSTIEPAAGGSDVEITMKPTPKIKSGEFEWQPTGRLHIDYAAFDDDQRDHPNGAEVRRARLGMKGKVSRDFAYKFEADFANEGVAFRDAYMQYQGIENTAITIGNQKPPLGLGEITSSNDITFIERSSPTNAFIRGHILGASVATHGEQWSLSGGVYNDDVGVQSSDDEAWSAGVRGTVTPILDDGKLVHLGASATYREPDQANEQFDFDSRADNALQSVDSVSARFGNADNAQLYGFEAAAKWGPVSAQGEYFMVDVERSQGSSLDFSGGYAQASWVLSGEERSYKNGSGVFGGVKPENAFSPRDGGWGAFEVAARYSHLDVSDQDVLGGEMENYAVGLNWYLNDYARLMANYIVVDTDQNAVTPNDDPQILLLRSQVKF